MHVVLVGSISSNNGSRASQWPRGESYRRDDQTNYNHDYSFVYGYSIYLFESEQLKFCCKIFLNYCRLLYSYYKDWRTWGIIGCRDFVPHCPADRISYSIINSLRVTVLKETAFNLSWCCLKPHTLRNPVSKMSLRAEFLLTAYMSCCCQLYSSYFIANPSAVLTGRYKFWWYTSVYHS